MPWSGQPVTFIHYSTDYTSNNESIADQLIRSSCSWMIDCMTHPVIGLTSSCI